MDYEQSLEVFNREYKRDIQMNRITSNLSLESQKQLIDYQTVDAQRTTQWMYEFSKQNPDNLIFEQDDQ